MFIDAHANPQYGTIHASTRTEEDAVAEQGEHKENKEYPCIYQHTYMQFVFISCVIFKLMLSLFSDVLRVSGPCALKR